jgi:hypothetical protein
MRGPAEIVMVSGFIPPAPLSNIIAHAQAGWKSSILFGRITQKGDFLTALCGLTVSVPGAVRSENVVRGKS